MTAANPHPRALLAELEQKARKRFGQHFLHDDGLVDRIVRAARVAPGDRVVEIGPGLGILSRALLRAQAQVTAVELDRDLAAFLRETLPELHLIEGDALRVDWGDVAPGSGWKVVANLPYNVGTHVLMDLLRQPHRFASVTVMLQQEVLDRLMATPGGKAWAALSAEAQVRAEPIYLLPVPPGAFHPPPKVRSGVVRFDLYEAPRTGGVDPAWFDHVVRAAFVHRRKTLLNSLAATFPRDRVAQALGVAGIDPGVRAETLGLPALTALARALASG